MPLKFRFASNLIATKEERDLPTAKLEKWLPGLAVLRSYESKWFRADLVAGMSVAAVAIPIGLAYAQLAGASPVVGIYSCILPPVAYALFGSSRQLIVNPDSAACLIVAATVTPLAAGDALRYADLSLALTLMVGVLCIIAGIARLGFIANFLSRPILVGYLNGIALSIIVGQVGKLLGIDVAGAGFFRTAGRVISQISQTHWPTMIVGLSLKYFAPKVPGPLVGAVLSIGLMYILRLDLQGVKVVGALPAGFPAPRIPVVGWNDFGGLAAGACSIVLVSFCSMMTTARGFAANNGYPIRPSQDLVALGVCDLASGFSQGFVVSGADSRTAVADSTGGKTQVTSVVAAATMLIVLLFLTAPLAYLPSAALAAILITSAIGLFDISSLRRYYRISKPEFRHSVIAMLGVMTVGVLPGVLVAVGVSIMKLLMIAAHPHDAVLGVAPGKRGFSNLAEEPSAGSVSGMIIYRFDASLVFFNADRFKERVRTVVQESPQKPEWFVFDAESVPFMDTTAADALSSLHTEMAKQGIVLVIARSKGFFRLMLERAGLAEQIGAAHLFPTIEAAVEAYERRGVERGQDAE